MAAETRTSFVGCCELFDEIARGGYATVHLARWLGAGGFARTVAVKCLHKQHAGQQKVTTMFANEARIVARIRHPNVMPSIDLVDRDGDLFMVMEYVHGLSLARLAKIMKKEKKSVPLTIAVKIMLGVLEGLHAAHDACDEHGSPMHMVHRDVSPSNILIGVDGFPRILDFGVAKAVGLAETTVEGEIKGKLAYMSPEQLSGQAVSRSTDIFAAATVLWEMLSGRRLFKGESVGLTVRRIIAGEIPPPSKFCPWVTPELDRVVLRGLRRDADKRWETAADFAMALERCCDTATVREVADWVSQVGRDVLHKREEKIRRMERSPIDVNKANRMRRERISLASCISQTATFGGRGDARLAESDEVEEVEEDPLALDLNLASQSGLAKAVVAPPPLPDECTSETGPVRAESLDEPWTPTNRDALPGAVPESIPPARSSDVPVVREARPRRSPFAPPSWNVLKGSRIAVGSAAAAAGLVLVIAAAGGHREGSSSAASGHASQFPSSRGVTAKAAMEATAAVTPTKRPMHVPERAPAVAAPTPSRVATNAEGDAVEPPKKRDKTKSSKGVKRAPRKLGKRTRRKAAASPRRRAVRRPAKAHRPTQVIDLDLYQQD